MNSDPTLNPSDLQPDGFSVCCRDDDGLPEPLHSTGCWWVVSHDDGRAQSLGDPEVDAENVGIEYLWFLTTLGTCETSGYVEAPTGWFALIEDVLDCDFVIGQDSQGFRSIRGSFDHIAIDAGGYYQPARRLFDELSAEYDRWDDDEDDDDDPALPEVWVILDDEEQLASSVCYATEVEAQEAITLNQALNGTQPGLLVWSSTL